MIEAIINQMFERPSQAYLLSIRIYKSTHHVVTRKRTPHFTQRQKNK